MVAQIEAYRDEWTADGQAPFAGPPPEFPGSQNQAWSIGGVLRRRKLLMFGIALPVMLLASAAILDMPKTYTATSSVIVDGGRSEAVRLGPVTPDVPFGPDRMASEVEILGSEDLIQNVVQKLHLTSDPEFNQRLAQTETPAFLARGVAALQSAVAPVWQPVRDTLVDWGVIQDVKDPEKNDLRNTVLAVRGRLIAAPVGVSRVIHITFSSHNPDMAALVANTVARTYIQTHVALTAKETVEAHDWIDQRLTELRDRASQSALVYERARVAAGLSKGSLGTITQEQISQVSTELTKARQQLSEAQAITAQAQQAGLPELEVLANSTGSPLLPRLREQEAQATARMAELSSRYGASSPALQAIRAQVADIDRSIAKERGRLRQTLQSRVAVAQLDVDRLTRTLDDLKGRLGEADLGQARLQALERNAAADRELYTSFVARSRETDPEVNYQSADVRLLSPAAVPLQPTSPNKRLLFPIAFLGSLGLGAVAAMGKENARRGLLSTGDVERTVGLVPLGLIPFVKRNDKLLSRVFDEAVAYTLARAMMSPDGLPLRSLLVTSSLPQEGKTRTAIALARAASEQGLKVLLVDADLRSRSLSRQAGLEGSNGTLVQVLRGGATVENAVHFSSAWGFFVMPAGVPAGSPVNLLATGAWQSVLRRLQGRFDIVVVDSPPVLAGGDAWLLARHTDRTLVLARWRTTSVATLSIAVNQLLSAGAKIAGVALTMVSSRENSSYGHGDAVMFSPKLLRSYDVQRRIA